MRVEKWSERPSALNIGERQLESITRNSVMSEKSLSRSGGSVWGVCLGIANPLGDPGGCLPFGKIVAFLNSGW